MTQQMDQTQGHETPHTVPLTATLKGKTITVSGSGGATLKKNSGAHRFDFTIESPPGLNVQFATLDTEDNCSTCPPQQGRNSQQIVGVQVGRYGESASFTNKNNNKQPMDVAYQWNFTCDDPELTVEPFDPIIKNGGTTGIIVDNG